jgi:drug/metabolite transporter (DMT)-like permease
MTPTMMFKLTRWAAGSAAVLTGVAMLLYPGGTLLNPSTHGYSFFQNSLSDLGSTVAWGGQPNSRAAQLLTAGFGILALAGVGCFIALVRLYSCSQMTLWLARTAGVAGCLSCAGLIGASLTPEDGNLALHGRFTLLAFGAFLLAILLFAWTTALNDRFPRRVPLGWLVLALVFVAWVSVTPREPATALELTIPVTLQKIVAIAVLVIFSFQSYEAERAVAAGSRTRGLRNHGSLGKSP